MTASHTHRPQLRGLFRAPRVFARLLTDSTTAWFFPRRRAAGLALAVPLMALAAPLHATTHSLGESTTASPISVVFDDATGRMNVTVKSTGTVWTQGTAGGGSSWASPTGWTEPDDLHTSGSASLNGYTVTVALEITPASGELKVTLGGNTVNIANYVVYPYPLVKSDGSGYAVLPFNGGFVVPTSATTWSQPSSHTRMEWVGGTDSSWTEGWMAIAEPAADMFLVKQTATVGGNSRLGGAFEWRGSNANASLTRGLLSYSRTATYTFYTSGGYVAQAKHFRDYATTKGWNVSLATKAAANPDVNKLLGAPVIYLWGDGRSDAMLNALDAAGIDKALIQLSINHVDQDGYFPNQAYANGSGWSSAVRGHGYVPGIYDIYAGYDTNQISPSYNGFLYLWSSAGAGSPSTSSTWAYYHWDQTAAAFAWDFRGTQANVAQSLASVFARDTRLPSHISQFDLDAFFFDTTCAVEPEEDYAGTYGHTATRAQDIAARVALLAAASGASSPNHNKLAGTEQAKSWAVPYLDWAEGMFTMGSTSFNPGHPSMYGAFTGPVYPEILTDVKDPGTQFANLLTTGFQAPLWELVYHDDMLSTQHWHFAHNKFLYLWDFADLNAMIRGQAPILHLAYDGVVGSAGRTMAAATDADTGKIWTIRWLNTSHGSSYADVAARVMQTYSNVCAWQGIVGDLPMIDHKILTKDASNNYLVQNSEFSSDGGASGYGIVVNFGSFPGTGHVMTGSTWNGTIRGNSLSAPVGSYATYSWTATDTTPPSVSVTAPTNGATVSGTISVTASASDNVGVAGVQFKLDGANVGAEDTASPYGISWDTTTATPGSHTLTAVARDGAGNGTTSSSVSVTVADQAAPSASVTAPTNGATVSGTISVTASASDNVGVAGVQFKLDGANLGAEDTTTPYSISWDTTSASAGTHTLTAVARDTAGNTTTSPGVSVTVNNANPTTVTLESVAAEDGWILESSETSGVGGTNNSANTTLWIGDDASRKQYKLIVSFDTSTIPAGATILSATLKLTRSTVTGTNPFSWSGNVCYADIRTGGFNGSTSLENADFQATATATQVVTMSSPASNNTQSTGGLNSSGLSAINKTGRTQFRVYFSQDDNNNSTADYLQLYSSNYTTDTSRRPKLEVIYQ